MNLASSLASIAAAHPDRVAIRNGEYSMTYRDLDDTSARVAGLRRAPQVCPAPAPGRPG